MLQSDGGLAPGGPTADFLDPAQHVQALLGAFSLALAAGQGDRAFALMDRLCRITPRDGLHLLLRAEASRSSGYLTEAREDLSLALAEDPTDPAILNFALRYGGSDSQARAARQALTSPLAARSLTQAAVDRLFERGESFLFSLRACGDRVRGFAAWSGPDDVMVRIAPSGAEHRLIAEPQHWLATLKRSAVALDLPLGDIAFFRAGLRRGGRNFSPPPRFSDPALPPAELTIIVPVYEDFAATKICFEALYAGGAPAEARLIAVDDASPNPALRAWLDSQAQAKRLTLLRNPANLGFAASVNRALALCPAGDVILLNADTLPPPGALARLALIARRHQVGTATPLTNNGEELSFPTPFQANPLPEAAEIARLDALAAQANGMMAVDIPNGVGFCLFISRACLNAVGHLPERYERGYFEDVDYCLQAAARQFRNVAAPGVFVGHAGSLSFRDDKRGLVQRNLRLLSQRFPRQIADGADFFAIDPLRAARGAIEALQPSPQPRLLLVAATPLARHLARARARQLAAAGQNPLLCLIEQGEARLRGGDKEAPPCSLNFPRDRYGDLARYLGATAWLGIEIYDALALSSAMLTLLRRLDRPLKVVAGALEWVVALKPGAEAPCVNPESKTPCEACAALAFSDPEAQGLRRRDVRRKRALLAHAAIAPLDALAEKLARKIFPAATLPAFPGEHEPQVAYLPPSRQGALALLAPVADPLAERFIAALARAIGPSATPRVILFGAAIDDLELMKNGAIFVAGAVKGEEWPRLMRQYRIAALGSPYRGALFGPLDALARRFSLPKFYFDYSFGDAGPDKKDLALDPRLCDVKAADLAAAWLQPTPSARASVSFTR